MDEDDVATRLRTKIGIVNAILHMDVFADAVAIELAVDKVGEALVDLVTGDGLPKPTNA